MQFKFICNNCGSKFNEGETCPLCQSTNINLFNSAIIEKADDKCYVVYYVDEHNTFHYACKDSKFRIITNVCYSDEVRFFTEAGAIKAIRGMSKILGGLKLHTMKVER